MNNTSLPLAGVWDLRADGEKESVPCPVPGDNYSALQDAGRIPDPYWRDNEAKVQWVADRDWVFSRTFDVPASLLGRRAVFLSFDSIDTIAEVFVNGRHAGSADNQFRRWRFEVKRLLRPGVNQVEVRIASPRRKAMEEHDRLSPEIQPGNMNDGSVHGLECLRKCQCSAGWDWGVSLPASGLYGRVELVASDDVLLDAAWTTQTHAKGACHVEATIRLAPLPGAEPGTPVTAAIAFGDETRTIGGVIPADLAPFELSATFRVTNPRLWWPNGYGDQPLHPFSAEVSGQRIDRRIGLRRLEIVSKPDKDGIPLVVKVNGVPVFAKGANWIPCDARPRHEDDARVGDLLASAAAANMNMLRVWGGGHFESDFFYDECDRLGILLWHDMMFACTVYNVAPEFVANVRAEADYQVRRLRDHASIALWCGDNECLSSIDWGQKPQDEREALTARWAVLNRALGDAVRVADPTRLFWPTSPCAAPGDFRHNNVNLGTGDTHYWAVWSRADRLELCYPHQPRFCTEFGFQSFPSPEAVRLFASEVDGDLNVFSPVFDCHQKNGSANAKILGMFGKYFRMPKGFDETLYLSQVQQAEAIRMSVEWWRSLRPWCMGTLFWQLDDNWPVASWSSLEWDGRWKALHHAARRFYAPLATFAFRRDERPNARPPERPPLEAHLVWDLPSAIDATVTVALRRIADGAAVKSWTFRESLPRAASRPLPLPAEISAPLPDRSARGVRFQPSAIDPSAHFLSITTVGRTADGRVFRHGDTAFLDVWKRCDLPLSGLAVRKVAPAKDGKGCFDIELAAKAPAFFAWLAVADDPGGRFSDNLVTVLPDTATTIRYRPGAHTTTADLRRRLSVMDLRATY